MAEITNDVLKVQLKEIYDLLRSGSFYPPSFATKRWYFYTEIGKTSNDFTLTEDEVREVLHLFAKYGCYIISIYKNPKEGQSRVKVRDPLECFIKMRKWGEAIKSVLLLDEQ